jgi:hypothetical protein
VYLLELREAVIIVVNFLFASFSLLITAIFVEKKITTVKAL